jgi:hypothetical protein
MQKHTSTIRTYSGDATLLQTRGSRLPVVTDKNPPLSGHA